MKMSSKGLNKHFLSDSSDGLFEKYRKVLDEATNISSINRGYRAINFAVYTYEQRANTRRIHTDPLDI